MFYTKCDVVTPEIKRLAESLVRRWMRPILGKSEDHRHKEVLQVNYNPKGSKPKTQSSLSLYTNIDVGLLWQ
jgi:hypothetical protein